MNENTHDSPHSREPKWQPLPPICRRVIGVLVEKAKTTPAGYPMSINAIMTGCNQKSNRSPQMEIDTEDVEDTLQQLRQIGAIGEIVGGGRVAKYRHYMKEWLDVDGTELGVMAELLLRGAQTIGELRGRAARMVKIPDVQSLTPILQSLIEKGLVVELTPSGRGQVVAHTLYEPRELTALQTSYNSGGNALPTNPESAANTTDTDARVSFIKKPELPSSTTSVAPPPEPPSTAAGNEITELRAEITELREEVVRLKREIEDLWANIG